jgi:signal peptidase I
MDETFSEDNDNEAGSTASRVRMELYDWLQCIVMAIIGAVLIFVFIGRTIGVDGGSMMQTLQHEDRVIMSNLFYTPDNGDIVVFWSPSDEFEYPLVKRVIATAGQTVDICPESGDVLVDGILIDEPYIHAMTTNRHDFIGPLMVPRGFIFVMGDNRNRSTDSRSSLVGLVDTRYILGKVLFVLVPGVDDLGHRDWQRFGLPE